MDSIPVLEERGEFDDSGRKLVYEDANEAEQQATILCCKTDGRSWQCRKEAAAGSSMCTHHLDLTRHPVPSKKHNIAAAVVETGTPTPRRTHPRPKKASSSSSNPYEFYYYSGCGSRWGKKRGGVLNEDNNSGSEEIAKNVENNEQEMDNQRSTLMSQNIIIGDDHFDYVEYEDEEEEEINGKKRARKPIKASSLKSLM